MATPLPAAFRELQEGIEKRVARLPTAVNEYGYDPFGFSPDFFARTTIFSALLYRYYFRVETTGIEKVPAGRVLLVANHGGNTIAMDGAMLEMAMFLEGEPPRVPRGMAEFYLPRIPWFSTLLHRGGGVVGTPENCARLLEHGEAVMVFPEGARGFIKPYSKAYQLQRFGTGFVRLALETRTPIVPVGIVGSEEQSPGLFDSKRLGRLINAPAFPITITFPWLGVLGYLPLPVKFRLAFGDPIQLEGDPAAEDAVIQEHVDRVRDRIAVLIEDGLSKRRSWFT